MAYKRKTIDTWELQANYGFGEGWECLTSELSYTEIKARRKEYRENQPGTRMRIRMVREKINK